MSEQPLPSVSENDTPARRAYPTRSLYQSGWNPRGVRRDWERTSMDVPSTARLLGKWHDLQKAEMTEAVAWFNASDSLRCLVADYENGKRIVMRANAGGWKISFERQP